MSTIHVQGVCPHGCGDTLQLDGDHHVICGNPTCPNAWATAQLLELVAR